MRRRNFALKKHLVANAARLQPICISNDNLNEYSCRKKFSLSNLRVSRRAFLDKHVGVFLNCSCKFTIYMFYVEKSRISRSRYIRLFVDTIFTYFVSLFSMQSAKLSVIFNHQDGDSNQDPRSFVDAAHDRVRRFGSGFRACHER